MTNDFSKLSEMKYSGRGITFGMTREGNHFVGYTLTGRSPSSQARKLVYDEKSLVVRTDVTDPEQLKKGNPALLIYPAIVYQNELLIASNGIQTEWIRDNIGWSSSRVPVEILERTFSRPSSRYDSQNGWIDITSFEPDAPNFTPRINALVNNEFGAFLIVKRSFDGKFFKTIPLRSSIKLERGAARTVTTYKGGNESPLLPFEGLPLEARVGSLTVSSICESLYAAIGPKDGQNYRVAAAVMMYDNSEKELRVSIINRSERRE